MDNPLNTLLPSYVARLKNEADSLAISRGFGADANTFEHAYTSGFIARDYGFATAYAFGYVNEYKAYGFELAGRLGRGRLAPICI
jgi:hypothetical protein